MIFHVLGLPDTITNKEFIWSAHTQKILNFCQMMYLGGHTVYHYGHKDSKLECSEHISVSETEIKVDTSKIEIKDTFNASMAKFEHRAIEEIAKRKKNLDFLICFSPTCYSISKHHSDLITIEMSIGSLEAYLAKHRVFESECIRNLIYGRYGLHNKSNCCDAVIPPSFDFKDFKYKKKKDDYFLFIGRILKCKGLEIAVEATRIAGCKLLIGGQGDYVEAMGSPPPEHVTLIGYLDLEDRRKYLSKAKCLLAPSLYSEPFGYVVAEAMISGTPVISSDWGAFPENNIHRLTGFRCKTLKSFVWACKNIHKIKAENCRKFSHRYSYKRVRKLHETYLKDLFDHYNSPIKC